VACFLIINTPFFVTWFAVTVVRNICKTTFDIFVVYLLCSYLYRLAKMTTCDVCYTSVNCSFWDSVHGTVSFLTNRFLSVTESQTLGFGRRRYGRFFPAIAGLLVNRLFQLVCGPDANKSGKQKQLLTAVVKRRQTIQRRRRRNINDIKVTWLFVY